MRCNACHQLNRDDVRFCVECGASLALTTWTQPTPPAGPHVPPPYAPPEAAPRVLAAAAGPGSAAYPSSTRVPGAADAPYGYILVPAPAPGPSVVNNVTVTQMPPPTPTPAPLVVTGQHADGLGIFLRALYFLGSGVVLGGLWDEASRAAGDGHGEAIAVALLVTLLVLVLHMVVLHRLARR